jgi:hypothetical protein
VRFICLLIKIVVSSYLTKCNDMYNTKYNNRQVKFNRNFTVNHNNVAISTKRRIEKKEASTVYQYQMFTENCCLSVFLNIIIDTDKKIISSVFSYKRKTDEYEMKTDSETYRRQIDITENVVIKELTDECVIDFFLNKMIELSKNKNNII